jgi:hypothetical protein
VQFFAVKKFTWHLILQIYITQTHLSHADANLGATMVKPFGHMLMGWGRKKNDKKEATNY